MPSAAAAAARALYPASTLEDIQIVTEATVGPRVASSEPETRRVCAGGHWASARMAHYLAGPGGGPEAAGRQSVAAEPAAPTVPRRPTGSSSSTSYGTPSDKLACHLKFLVVGLTGCRGSSRSSGCPGEAAVSRRAPAIPTRSKFMLFTIEWPTSLSESRLEMPARACVRRRWIIRGITVT